MIIDRIRMLAQYYIFSLAILKLPVTFSDDSTVQWNGHQNI